MFKFYHYDNYERCIPTNALHLQGEHSTTVILSDTMKVGRHHESNCNWVHGKYKPSLEACTFRVSSAPLILLNRLCLNKYVHAYLLIADQMSKSLYQLRYLNLACSFMSLQLLEIFRW